MTGSDGGWVRFPDAQYYEGHPSGQIRSHPREKENGRVYGGTYPDPMKLREDGDGYLVFNYTDDDGVRHTNVSVARTILRLFDPDWRPWLQACHNGDQKDNSFPGGIRTDTPEANREEALALRLERNPPRVKPPKVCPRCGAEHQEKGKNCRECFEGIGVEFTRLLVDGVPPEDAADQVGYPLNGALNLALRYGGLRFVTEAGLNVMLSAASHAASHSHRLRSVLFRRGASRGNSD
jgi:hypothetical protein